MLENKELPLETILDILVKYGFSMKHKGTYFLAYICQMLTKRNTYDFTILDTFYIDTAQHFKAHYITIEKNIRIAIEYAFKQPQFQNLSAYYRGKKRPPNRDMIYIMNKVLRKYI